MSKKIVRMVIYMSAFLGIVTLLIQAMTVNDAVNYWGNMWNIPLKGNQHQIHFILTIVIMLIWSIITIYNGASNNVWKNFFIVIVLSWILTTVESVHIYNLRLLMHELEKEITQNMKETIRGSIALL